MRIFSLVVLAYLIIACSPTEGESASNHQFVSSINNMAILETYKNKQSNVWVEGSGEVIKLLKDDTRGSQHQRFLVKLSMREKQTLLFAHNIDLAPRINSLQVGDTITFKGEYEYNPKGGVVHWTHHDPDGDIAGGWIKHEGTVYE